MSDGGGNENGPAPWWGAGSFFLWRGYCKCSKHRFRATAERSHSAQLPEHKFAGAARADVHEAYDAGDGLRGMRTVPDGVPVAAGATVALAPGGFHAMLVGLAAPLAPGDTLDATATFARAGRLPIRAGVRALGEMPAP